MTDSPYVDVSETKAAAACLLDQGEHHRPVEVLNSMESQGALDTLRKDATFLATDPNFMKDQWVLNQQFDGFPKIMINNDRSITVSGGFSDGSRTISVKPNEIDVTDQYGQKGYSGTEIGRKTY